jgi:glycosyltransferase involved in cell wall biosynthesis
MEEPLKYNFPLSIVMPVYNEEEILHSSLHETYCAALSLLTEFEMIIVNDASTDASHTIIRQFQNKHANICSVTHEANKGFGGAIKSGISKCQYGFVLCVPADSPMDETTLKQFLQVCQSADLVISYRLNRVGYSNIMRFNSWAYHLLISILFGLRLKDYNWIHLYRSSIFKDINIYSGGIFMLAEVIISASRKQLKIVEIPVVQRQRISGSATSAKLSTIINVLKELMRYLLRS